MRLNTKGASLATERHQKASAASNVAETAKVVSFIDLAGHERYLRTTVYGLTAHEVNNTPIFPSLRLRESQVALRCLSPCPSRSLSAHVALFPLLRLSAAGLRDGCCWRQSWHHQDDEGARRHGDRAECAPFCCRN